VRAAVVESRPPRREPIEVDEPQDDLRVRDHVGTGEVIDDTEAPWSPVPLGKAREFIRKRVWTLTVRYKHR